MRIDYQQIIHFTKDIEKNLGKNKIRIVLMIFSPVFWGLFKYRFDRFLSLLFGKYYVIARLPLFPFFLLLEFFSRMDIHYKADISGGLRILHTSVGIVISGNSIIGENLILTGGNVIGGKADGSIVIGNNCSLGANATVIGPLKLGDNIRIGASACVVRSFESNNLVLVGVPAKPIG